MVKSPFPWQDSTRFPLTRKAHLNTRDRSHEEEPHDPTSRGIDVSQRGPHGRPQAHRADRDPGLSRYLGAPRPLQARPEPHHGGGPDGDVPARSAQGAHRAGARQRRHQGGDRRAHHAPGVLRGLAQRDVGGQGRQTGLRGGQGMKVGFIGLGTMGASMASNLQAGGHELSVSDVRREAAAPHLKAGATWKDTPRQVAEGVEVVFTSLPGPKEVEQVAIGPDGLIHGMKKGAAYFDLSTNSPALMRRLYPAFKEKGIHVLDAPVSGGPKGAKSRKLALWIGGDREIYDRFKPVLDAIGDQPYYVGPIGAGSVAKLVHNCAGYAVQTALAEVFIMGVKGGVDALPLWKAVRQGAGGRRRTFDGLVDQFLPGSFDPPAFTLTLAHKDVSLATALGRELGVPMRVANLTLEEMTEALNRGWGPRDSRVAMLLQEERAGVHIAVPPEKIREVLEQDGVRL